MKKVIIIVGPTGVGKSDLSVRLAKKFNSEIISGDSVQIYKGLDIGSGKIMPSEMDGVKHHLLDILNVTDEYSVSDFQYQARKIINDSDKVMIVTGGTGFYIKALINNYEFSNQKRTNEFDDLTNDELFNRLKELNDPEIPDINNRKRLLRHLENITSKDVLITKNEKVYDSLIIGLTADREFIYDKINKRVDKMISNGLLDEVKSFYDKSIRTKALQSIGYKELYDYFDGTYDLEKSIELIKQHSRNYAKRQYTWFNNQMDVKWIDIQKEDAYTKSVEYINEFLKGE